MSVRAMKDGAIEFLGKPFRDRDLLDAIEHGIEKDRARRRDEAVAATLNKQIAAELDVSEITVKVRRHKLMRKMHANSLADLVMLAYRISPRPGP